ncbi:outer membrane protein assembly factor BamA [Alcanivorax sp. JB21]|uniref:outer membrane protein assembly factor BamA n=1 Tax=Alcanivorax limicola TaxID=2874102 RepID=UPI001CBAF63C|nr:outer membrane protein assembly factor BamA [Alcanivorax limicola]MBZ2188396.1 outer membrane protein assembly factor BamA [Alcanivorax limicola]
MRFALVILTSAWLAATLTFGAATAAASERFRVSDIRVEGLQRLPVDRVFTALPIQSGDLVGTSEVAEAVRRLYGSGDFEDVQIGRDGDQLVVVVSERPSIARLEIKGNRSIDEDNLRAGLRDAGLAEGEVFRRSTLEMIAGELQRQYVSQGRYDAQIETESVPLPRNRVALNIDIYEGNPARIRDINIVGNEVFSDKELRSIFEQRPRRAWWPFGSRHRYSRERLSGDLERLRSYYLDRGYINFSMESTQVGVTPDRKDVYITINVDEGKRYRVGKVTLAGDLPIDEEELKPLLVVQEGQVFSQQLSTYTADLLTRRLGNEGYSFAEVNDFPEVSEDGETVDVTFFVDPGRKVYVRRVNFSGNAKTEDEVLRRELRQFEGAPANTALVDLSRQRLQRLGYFGLVNAETPRVVGAEDLVDVDYTVEEQPSGSIGANVGYSEASGFIFGASISQNNFMGTGNRVSFALSRSDIRESYSFSHFNPYYTLDGVSRGFSLYYSKIDFSRATVASYAADRLGGAVNYGYPISETSRLDFGVGFDNIELTVGNFVAVDILRFLEAKGYEFNLFKANASWQKSTLNRGILPDRGWSQVLGAEAAVPGSDYLFYKVTWNGQRYFPVGGDWTLRARGDLGYGDGYGNQRVLPFFENFYAGGIGSVRGYRSRTLGPRSPAAVFELQNPPVVDPDPDPLGGNLLVEGSLELIFPTPFAPESRNVRTFFFVDGGQVFETEIENLRSDFDVDEIRYAGGIGLTWLTAIGPLSFNIARPLNKQSGDDTEFFQFSLGQVF